MGQLKWFSVKDFQDTVIRFKKLIEEAREDGNIHDLMNTKRVLELYLRAIDNDISNYPVSSFSRRIVEHEHKRLYKYD